MTRDPMGRRSRPWQTWGLALAFTLACVLLPLLFPAFRVSQFTLVLVYAVATLGLTLITGYAGAVSVGHGAFFALGAYTSAILATQLGWPVVATVPIAGVAAGVFGYLFGRPALRVRGLYLALLTLALAVIVPPLASRFSGLTGGSEGLVVDQPAPPAWTGLAVDQWYYYIALAAAIILFIVMRRILRGGPGRALLASADNSVVAATVGVDITRYRTRAFVIGTAYAGLAGGLYTMAVGFVAPTAFGVTLSLLFLSALVVGGSSQIAGALIGAIFIEFVPLYAGDVDPAFSGLVYGVVLVLVILLMPAGVVGALSRLAAVVTKRA